MSIVIAHLHVRTRFNIAKLEKFRALICSEVVARETAQIVPQLRPVARERPSRFKEFGDHLIGKHHDCRSGSAEP
nr:hypothetical protein Iba_chr05fCG9030 [Ipomoea batatas]